MASTGHNDEERRARLAEALRANLRRRKAQARAIDAAQDADARDAEAPDGATPAP